MSHAAAKENSAIELVKSLLVVPLVIGLVLATGWGLVRWAAHRQADSGKPDPRPAEPGPDGSLKLGIPFAQVTGEIHYGGGAYPLLENWRRPDETVAWRFEIEKPGRYVVELDCASDAADAGSVVLVEMDASSLETTIPDTLGRRSFKTVRAGEVEVTAAGWHDLRIVPVKIAHGSVMVLRGVRLTPSRT